MHLTVEAPRQLRQREQTIVSHRTTRAPGAFYNALFAVLLVLVWFVHWRTFTIAELGVDGALSIDLALGPFRDMLAFTAHDTHPPLFYALLHWWFSLVGPHELTAKFIPIASATTALAVVYRIGSRLLGNVSGILGAILFAASPAYVMMSPTVRDFSVGLFFSLLSLWLALRLLDRVERGRSSVWIGAFLSVVTAAALLTWYFHLVFVLTELGIVVVLRRRSVRAALQVLWPLTVGVAAAAPWYAIAVPTVSHMLKGGVTAFDRPPSLPSAVDAFGYVSEAVVGLNDGWPAVIGLAAWFVALGTGIVLCSAKWRNDQPDNARTTPWILYGGLALGVGEALPFALRWAEPGAITRYILALLPFVALLQSGSVFAKHRLARGISIVALLCVFIAQVVWGVGLLSSAPIPYTNDPTFTYLDGHVRDGDAIIFTDRQRRARFLLHGTHVPTAVIQTAGARYLTNSAAEAVLTTSSLLPRYQRLWLVLSNQPPYAEPVAQTALASRAYVAEEREIDSPSAPLRLFLDTKLTLYETGSPTASRPYGARLGSSISLVRAAYTVSTHPGATIDVALVWRADRAVDVAYTVFVHLDDAQGHLVAQHDGTPMAGLRPTDQWRTGDAIEDLHALVPRDDLPPGDYRLNVGMYRGSERLRLPDGSDTIPLGVVHVGS